MRARAAGRPTGPTLPAASCALAPGPACGAEFDGMRCHAGRSSQAAHCRCRYICACGALYYAGAGLTLARTCRALTARNSSLRGQINAEPWPVPKACACGTAACARSPEALPDMGQLVSGAPSGRGPPVCLTTADFGPRAWGSVGVPPRAPLLPSLPPLACPRGPVRRVLVVPAGPGTDGAPVGGNNKRLRQVPLRCESLFQPTSFGACSHAQRKGRRLGGYH